MIYISNAFSLNMIDPTFSGSINIHPVSVAFARAIASAYNRDSGSVSITSVVGHSDTASVFSAELGSYIPCNRQTVSLRPGDDLMVGQYRGPRLQEGATALPEGATITWSLVSIPYP